MNNSDKNINKNLLSNTTSETLPMIDQSNLINSQINNISIEQVFNEENFLENIKRKNMNNFKVDDLVRKASDSLNYQPTFSFKSEDQFKSEDMDKIKHKSNKVMIHFERIQTGRKKYACNFPNCGRIFSSNHNLKVKLIYVY
jgi:hypothetical protein